MRPFGFRSKARPASASPRGWPSGCFLWSNIARATSVLITNSVGICGNGFLVQTRRERRAYPSAVCKERTTKPGPKRHAAGGLHRIWLLALLLLGHRSLRICSLVAPRQKPNAVQQMPTQFVNSTLGRGNTFGQLGGYPLKKQRWKQDRYGFSASRGGMSRLPRRRA